MSKPKRNHSSSPRQGLPWIFRPRKIGLKGSIGRYYGEIKKAKELGRNAPEGIRRLIARLRQMVHEGKILNFEGWSLPRIMAYLFLVNGEFHHSDPDPRLKRLKYLAQFHILVKYPENIIFVEDGQYRNCYQVTCGIWQSHWPSNDASHPANRILSRNPGRVPGKK